MRFQYQMLTPLLVEKIHSELRNDLLAKGFNNRSNLEHIFANIDFYPELEDIQPASTREKIEYMAAYLLFHLVKGHPFSDGNKRTAFLSFGVLVVINGLHAKYTEERVKDKLDLLYQKLEEHQEFDLAFNEVFRNEIHTYEFELIRTLFLLGGAKGEHIYPSPLTIYPIVKSLISDKKESDSGFVDALISRIFGKGINNDKKLENDKDA